MDKTNPGTMTAKTLAGLLPTVTVFAFQFLSPPLTNNGHCRPLNRIPTAIFLAACGLSCVFSCFTDSYTDPDGARHHALYRLSLRNFVHVFFTIVVFCVVVVFDKNFVECFFSGFVAAHGTMLVVLPPVVGAVASIVFVAFPPTRHWIGYPSENDFSFFKLTDSLKNVSSLCMVIL
ncbi:hypothetical protein V2J09_013423 [Rumex salicifolius]